MYVNTVDFTVAGTATAKVPLKTYANLMLSVLMLISGAIGTCGYYFLMMHDENELIWFDWRLAHLFLAGCSLGGLFAVNCLHWGEARLFKCCRLYKSSEYEEI